MRIALILAAASVAATSVGCSSTPVTEPRAGTLLLGSARVTINGADVGLTDEVSCSVAGPIVTITTGTGDSGVTAMVSTENGLTAQAVNIQNLGGFTGSYHAGQGGTANVTATGRSYQITGTADGFTVSQPAIRTSGQFTVDVAC